MIGNVICLRDVQSIPNTPPSLCRSLLKCMFKAITASLVFAPAIAAACGSYQTCNQVAITKFDAAPLYRAEGDPVHVAMRTFEFANWYSSVSTMTFPVVALGNVANRTLVGSTVQVSNSGPFAYGAFPNYWYVQNTEWDSTLDWNGLDNTGSEVTVPVVLTVTVSAGAASATRTVPVFAISGKDIGRPECPVANPCNPASGNKYQEEIDFSGSEFIPDFVRHYNHMGGTDVGLGVGWTTRYHKRLRLDGTKLSVIRADGKRERFNQSGAIWMPDADSHLTVVQNVNGFALTLENGTAESYATDGRLLSETDLNGRTTRLTYDDANHLIQVTGPLGHAVVLGWTQNRISSMTPPSNAQRQYGYDPIGNLSALTWPDTTVRQYHYENTNFPHALTGITDENSVRYATWGYDTLGRVTTSTHAGGADATAFSYPSVLQTTVTMPLGEQRAYTFAKVLGATHYTQIVRSGASTPNATTQVLRDTRGNITNATDYNGNLITYTYEPGRNLETSRTEASGKPQARTITTSWHPAYRLPSQIAEPKRLTTFTYSPAGNLMTRTEQASTDTTGAAGFAAIPVGPARTWTYTHNGIGQLLTVTGPRTDVLDRTTYAYDSTSGNLDTITNAMGQVTTLSNYDADGRARKIVDPNGLSTDLTYSSRGLLTARTLSGPGVNETTGYNRDNVGQLKILTLPDTTFISYSYDDAHRLTRLTDSTGNSVTYTPDAMGNHISEQVKDPAGTLAWQIARNYDVLNRLRQVTGGAQ